MEKKIFLILFICAALCSGFSYASWTSTEHPQIATILNATGIKQKAPRKSEALKQFTSLLSKTANKLTNDFAPSFYRQRTQQRLIFNPQELNSLLSKTADNLTNNFALTPYRQLTQQIEFDRVRNKFASNPLVEVNIIRDNKNKNTFTINAWKTKKLYCTNVEIKENENKVYITRPSSSTLSTWVNNRSNDTNHLYRRGCEVAVGLATLASPLIFDNSLNPEQKKILRNKATALGTSLAAGLLFEFFNVPSMQDPRYSYHSSLDNLTSDCMYGLIATLVYWTPTLYSLYKKRGTMMHDHSSYHATIFQQNIFQQNNGQ